jgi:hypothetical protein
MIFIAQHKVYGNKWAEIAKFLNGRNDNSVKNYFYSSVRKIIRKISLKKLTYDMKDNDLERELTIYLAQYIYQMYFDYLNKKKMEKGIIAGNPNANDVSMEPNEESKGEKAGGIRTGDKYIIRKLVSLKITPEQIEDYVNMVISGQQNNGMMQQYSNQMNYGDYSPNINPYMEVNNAYMQPPVITAHNRSNS